MPRDHSASYRDRWLEEDVGDFVRRLCPEPTVLPQVAQFIAASMNAANQYSDMRWGITRKPHCIRVNVGRPEALTWAPGRHALDYPPKVREAYPATPFLAVMADIPTLKASDGERMLRKLIIDYRFLSTPNSRYVTLPTTNTSDFKRLADLVRSAHLRHLETATRSGVNGKTAEAHHPGLVEEIARLAGQAVPQPSFVRLTRPQGAGGPPAGDGIGANSTAGRQNSGYQEGKRRDVVQSKRERDPRARKDCLAHYGPTCCVCERAMEELYGAAAADLIHVHHLDPLAERDGNRRTDPIRDLRPVCPNCHGVIHRRANPPYSIEEVRVFLTKARRRLTRQ